MSNLAFAEPPEMTAPESVTAKMSCRNVQVHYGEAHALKGVDLDVNEREVLALIGPSGCGKSTFLRCLNRMNDTIIGARVSGRQAAFHHLIEIGLAVGQAMDARAIGDIVIDRFRERIRLLEHHSDSGPKQHRIDLRIIYVGPVDFDPPRHAADIDRIVHPVDTAQECRFAATRGSDKSHDLPSRNIDRYVEKRLLFTVEDRDFRRGDLFLQV